MGINKQLVRKEQIKTVLLLRLFDIFTIDETRSRNHRVMWFVPLKLEINEYTI